MRLLGQCFFAVILLAVIDVCGGATPPWIDLGGTKFDGWSGVKLADDGSAAHLSLPGEADFRFPNGPLGFLKHGFRIENDSTVDLKPFYGIRCEMKLADVRQVELTITVVTATPNGPDRQTAVVIRVGGSGWHTVTLPWSAMQFDQAGAGFLKFGKGFSVAGRFVDGNEPGQILIRNVRLVKGPVIALECDIRGKAAGEGKETQYAVQVSNCTDQPQSVALSFVKYGWEVMDAVVEPAALQLAPGASGECVVRVKVSNRVPPGGHEQQVLAAIANGDASSAQKITFVTVSELPHPYILHTSSGWQEVRDKVKNYSWAKDGQDAYVQTAQRWRVPEVAKPPGNDLNDTMGPFLFATQNENSLLACAYSWQLTGDKASAEKVAEFLRRLSNPQDGYAKTLRGCNQSLVQEGHFFQHIAMSYDMILDADVLSDDDKRQIESTFRIFMETINREAEHGSINNWNLSEDCGAFYCALAMQDLAAADRFFSGPSGIKDQLAKGTMDDGWWYECSISYNMWCASEFTQVGLAYQPFGINFKDMWVPASYSPSALLTAQLNGGNGVESADPKMKGKPFGMDPSIYGPTRRPYRAITDLWNGLLPFIDYRGVIFGVNDSTEARVAGNRTEVSGQPFEIAYYAYRDPKYASMIKIGGGKRDLLYGVPELPEKTPEQFRENAYADNVGLAMLRSQTVDRPIREQIEAVLHYGTHGWAHGHYDRTDLLCLMRYGRSFWNPESVFFVYEPFMYKFYTQTSMNHNMVVVDQKMQEATPGKRLLFHSGSAMQATAVETTARWSNPPYGGMVYDYVPVKTFVEKTWREGRYVPIPPNPPAYGTLTDFTEPILQRRLMVVTDDYVVLADYMKASQSHTFDNLLSIKGFLGLNGPQKKFLRHDAQWNTDPIGSGQFVTDCNWYSLAAPVVARFAEQFGPGADNEGSRSIGNEDGVLKLDVHTLWPPSQEIMVATAPEQHDTEKRLYYTVRGDRKVLTQGQFGAWILGHGDIDVPIDGIKQLELETRTELSKKPTLFWAGARVETADGREIPLSKLPLTFDNVVPANGIDQDYFGGSVKIAGNSYTDDVPAEPRNAAKAAVVHVDLSGVGAVRLKVVIGSDYPPGDESQRRKTYAVRVQGTEAMFLTLIEPYENSPMVKSVTANGPDQLHVELADGRAQEIQIANFTGDSANLSATLTETRDGKTVRTETTSH
jgi:hypothetical protein